MSRPQTPIILDKVATLTGIRDLDIFEFSFMKSLADMLNVNETAARYSEVCLQFKRWGFEATSAYPSVRFTSLQQKHAILIHSNHYFFLFKLMIPLLFICLVLRSHSFLSSLIADEVERQHIIP